MQRFLPYPNYKDSGLPWVGKIPAHWQAARLRYVARIANGTTPSRDRADYWDDGTVPWLNSGQVNDYIVRQARQFITPIAQKESSLRVFPKGSVIIALYGQGKTRGTAAYLNIDATINQALAGIESNHALDDRFLHYILIAGRTYLRNEGRGGSQPNLNCSIISSFTTPIPPRPEQDQIAHYLRIKDAQIARFIHTKRTLIARLNEQKLRIIDHAVTGGLNPSAPRKPSGVDWLGDVPEHWEIVLLKHIVDVRFSGVDKHSYAGQTPVRLCNYTDVYKNDCITESMDLMHATATPAEIARLTLQANDVILTKDSETSNDIGVPAWVPKNLPDVVCGYHLALLRPQPNRVLGEFLFHAIGSARITQQFHVLATGVTRFALGKYDVKNIAMPLPPLNEQHTIVTHIQSETKILNDAITHTEAQITLMREYRERLIADAVTGQIDLRGWQPGADDTPPDDALVLLADDPSEAGPDDEEPCDDA